jgi:trimethylamine--corrinoid protein Co-methyltransferase
MGKQEEARARFELLNENQLDLLHEASLRILAEAGVNVHSPALRELLKCAGARVDGVRAFIPGRLVEEALSTAPSRIVLHDRQGKPAMDLQGRNAYYGTGSDLEFTIDPAHGGRRRSTLEDVARSARLCERLPNIDFVMSYGLPADVPGDRREAEQMRVMLGGTRKPIIMTIFSGEESYRQVHELACRACGGDRSFRAAPNYIMYGQFISPLQHDSGSLDRLLFSADHAVPLIYVPTIMLGASGPVTLAGSVALANAECLAGLVMHQLRAPGAPFIYGGCVSPLDMKTTVFTYGSPEWRQADTMLSELSLRYRLPIFGTAGASDSKAVDAQAGAEWAYSLLYAAICGTNLIHDVGYLESGLTGSLEALVICDEIVSLVKKALAPVSLDEESLALENIIRVGPGGHHMTEDHTLAHFREVWYPAVFDRDRLEGLRQGGRSDLIARARRKVEDLLSD